MDLAYLKLRTAEIRSRYAGKRYVSWPQGFKKEVVAFTETGVTVKETAEALQISYPTVFSWRKQFSSKPKAPAFKPITIIENQKAVIELSWKQGLTAKGISFSEFKELLKEGLL